MRPPRSRPPGRSHPKKNNHTRARRRGGKQKKSKKNLVVGITAAPKTIPVDPGPAPTELIHMNPREPDGRWDGIREATNVVRDIVLLFLATVMGTAIVIWATGELFSGNERISTIVIAAVTAMVGYIVRGYTGGTKPRKARVKR